MENNIEELKNILNLEIRKLLSLIDMINGEQNEYQNYNNDPVTQVEYLKQQVDMLKLANEKLIAIFKS